MTKRLAVLGAILLLCPLAELPAQATKVLPPKHLVRVPKRVTSQRDSGPRYKDISDIPFGTLVRLTPSRLARLLNRPDLAPTTRRSPVEQHRNKVLREVGFLRHEATRDSLISRVPLQVTIKGDQVLVKFREKIAPTDRALADNYGIDVHGKSARSLGQYRRHRTTSRTVTRSFPWPAAPDSARQH
jgi:hypothetical protein